MSELPESLTERMALAANIIDEVRCEYAGRHGLERPSDSPLAWSAHDLRTRAAGWERQDAEAASEAAAIDQLAQDLARSAGYAKPDQLARERAADLYAMGYRKGGAS